MIEPLPAQADPAQRTSGDGVTDVRSLLDDVERLAARLDDVHLMSRLSRLQRLLDAVRAERPVAQVPRQAGSSDRRRSAPTTTTASASA